MNQCDGRISARDAYIIENLHTWCGMAACANTCMCLLTSFMEKTAFVWPTSDTRFARGMYGMCMLACVRA